MSSRPDVVVLQNVRLGFPKLFTAEASVENGRLKYSAHAIIDPETAEGKANIEKIKAAVKHVGTQEWGDKYAAVFKNLEKNRKAYRLGDTHTNSEGDIYAGYEGMHMVVAGRQEHQGRPQTLDRKKNPVVESDGVIYAGCYVDMIVSFYAVSGKERGGNGVFASLELVRFRGDGEAFGGGLGADAARSMLDELDDLDDEEMGESTSSGSDDMDDDLV